LGIDIDTTTGYFFAPAKSFRSSQNKPGIYCNVLHEPTDGSMSRNSNHSLGKFSTFSSLFRRQDSSCAICTPYLATSGEAESASPLSSLAIYNGGYMYQPRKWQ
jgi:hypothetical protein